MRQCQEEMEQDRREKGQAQGEGAARVGVDNKKAQQ
jgi:hypothetical protein